MGLKKRLCAQLPPPAPDLVHELGAFVQKWLSGMPSLQELPTFEEWISHAPYTEARRQELRLVEAAVHGSYYTKATRRVCQKVNSFIKTESYESFKYARWINSRVDTFKVISGPAFHAIEQLVFHHPAFVKFVPVPDRPALINGLESQGVHYLWTDYTSFEASFSREVMLAVECQLYRHCLGKWPQLASLICDTITGPNRLRTRAGMRATVTARRMSGDMCTSLGNGFTNLILMEFLAHRQGCRVRGFVEGDDGIFSWAGTPPQTTPLEDLGFRIKLQEVAHPSEAGFCGIMAADAGNIKSPARFLQTFGWTSSCVDAGPRVMRELLRAKALSACYELPNCPIIGAIARRALLITAGEKPRYTDTYHRVPAEFRVPPCAPTPATRALFERLFDVSPDAQVALERLIAAGAPLDVVAGVVRPNHDNVAYTARFVVTAS